MAQVSRALEALMKLLPRASESSSAGDSREQARCPTHKELDRENNNNKVR